MTIRILTIPDESARWPEWLEGQLYGMNLGELVEELRIMRASRVNDAPQQNLNKIVSQEQLQTITTSGLGGLPLAKLQELMGNPDSLLELQEHVLIHGDDYWSAGPPSWHPDVTADAAQLEQMADQVQKRVLNSIRRTTNVDLNRTVIPARNPSRRSLFALLGTALAVVLLGIVYFQMPPTGSGRILGQSGLTANNTKTAAEYLDRIADAGMTWFDQHPQSSAELIVLLEEVSNDCQILIDADHKALSPEERDWFVTKCQNWKKSFDATLAGLQANQLTFEDARAEADKTMMKLVNVLQAGPTA